MANEAGIELVRRLWDEGWNGGNVAVVDDVVAEDAVAHGKTGRQAWKDAIAFYRGMFPDLHYAVDEIFGADSRVVVRWTATATSQCRVVVAKAARPVDTRLPAEARLRMPLLRAAPVSLIAPGGSPLRRASKRRKTSRRNSPR